MAPLPVPQRLRDAAAASDRAEFRNWLVGLPTTVGDVCRRWELTISAPFEPGGQCAWVSPAVDGDGQQVVLKLGWPHAEAMGEALALSTWDGNSTVRVLRFDRLPDIDAMLLERCEPGLSISASLPEPERDPIIAKILLRTRETTFAAEDFTPLATMCDRWADECEARPASPAVDPGIRKAALDLLRSLPRDSTEQVLLFTDLHGDNVLSSKREPWLAIDPKPHVGDPAFDVVQHIGTSYSRMQTAPEDLVRRMSALADVDEQRVRLWLFCRAVQERPGKPWLDEAITRLAP